MTKGVSYEVTSMTYAIQVLGGEEDNTISLCKVIIEKENTDIVNDIYYPEIEDKKKFHGKWHVIKKKMFPGYIFIETCDVEKLWCALREVPKLTKLIGAGTEPVALSSEEVSFLMRTTGDDHVAEVSVGFIEGDKLVVTEGPLKGQEGLVKKIDRHKRQALLEIEMFGRPVEMTLGLEVVEKK